MPDNSVKEMIQERAAMAAQRDKLKRKLAAIDELRKDETFCQAVLDALYDGAAGLDRLLRKTTSDYEAAHAFVRELNEEIVCPSRGPS